MTSLILALLVAQAGPSLPPSSPFAPLAKAERGVPPRIEAAIRDDTGRFAPLVFARPAGQQRYSGYPMIQRGKGKWAARLPAFLTAEKSFEYFIEIRGGASYGSADAPFRVPVVEPEIRPARFAVSSDVAGVAVQGAAAVSGRTRELLVSLPPPVGAGTLSLSPRPGDPSLPLASTPPGAAVFIDGAQRGLAPSVGDKLAQSDHVAAVAKKPDACASEALAAPPPPPARWSLVVDAGVDHAFERYTDGAFGGRAGLSLSRTIRRFQFARLRADVRLSNQPYRTFQPTAGAPSPAPGFSEQRYSAAAEYGLDVAQLLFHSDRFELIPLAAFAWQHWQSSSFPADFAGPGGELRGRLHLARGLSVGGGLGYGWNLLPHANALSAVGAPRSDTWFDAGLSLAVSGSHSIDLVYRGDLLAVANDYRVSNGLTVGFGSTF